MIALTIAGSDSGGGAGIQADLKTFSALGVYGASVVTAITAQNTRGVTAVHPIPTDIVIAQLDAVLEDIAVDAIKIGMLGDPELVEALAERLEGVEIPIVLDTVMVAASGHRLVPQETMAAIRERLVPLARIITPNVPEAAALLDEDPVRDTEALARQARALFRLGPAVLLKGGHLAAVDSVDILITADGETRLSSPRTDTLNTHGTGCTLSSAIASGLARGLALADAVAFAKRYITGAIAAADTLNVGHGHGPVHHFHDLWSEGVS